MILMSEQPSEWPSTYVWILGCFGPWRTGKKLSRVCRKPEKGTNPQLNVALQKFGSVKAFTHGRFASKGSGLASIGGGSPAVYWGRDWGEVARFLLGVG